MNIDILGLVEKMVRRTRPITQSSVNESFQAYREAEGIDDRDALAMAMELVRSEKKKDRRKALYFIIGKVSLNLRDETGTRFLISQVAEESDKYVLSTILDLIRDLPKERNEDLAPIFGRLGDPRWLVRHAAIRALANSESETSEQILLTLLENTTDPSDQIYIHSTLNAIGSSRSLLLLRRGATSRKRDVRMSAELAIEAITKRQT